MTSIRLFTRKGRRYLPWGNALPWHEHDIQPVGTSRLITVTSDGWTRHTHDIDPDHAAFLAAASIAQSAMEQAINQAAIATPRLPTTYTPEQLRLVEQFRQDMAKAGALVPPFWTHSSARDIAAAAIEAVRAHLGTASSTTVDPSP